jgi:glycosyltransferase involved in cell wall biosynthesis
VDDVRWFAPNRFCTLPVPRLRKAGLRIALDGDAPARLTFLADATVLRPAFRYAWRHACPLVLYLWDIPMWWMGRGRPDPVFRLGGRLVPIPRLIGGYPGRHRYYSRLHFVAQRAVEVWCPSAATQRDVRERVGIEADRVPFCYDSDRFQRDPGRRQRRSGDTPALLSVSRLVAYKNHAAVLRAAALMTPRPRVHVIGRGPEAVPLQKLAETLDVALRLDDGGAADEDVDAAYRAASVVVCPSRFEGFGLTPMEGVAQGIPVVASDIPSHREFVGQRARLVPLDDDPAMAAAIGAALGDADRAGPGEPVLPDVTIEACAARFLPRLEGLLRRKT